MFAATWGTGQVLFDMLWFVLFAIELWLIFTIVVDLFRRHDIPGWRKAIWLVAIILVPLLGILVYLVLYGSEMRVHAAQSARNQQLIFEDYIRSVSGNRSAADELQRLADLRDRGILTDEEFQRLKDRVVNGEQTASRAA